MDAKETAHCRRVLVVTELVASETRVYFDEVVWGLLLKRQCCFDLYHLKVISNYNR